MANNKPYKLLDQQITDTLLSAIKLGAFIEHACYYAGINSSTFRSWRGKAEEGVEPYKSFWAEVTKAEAEGIIRRMARIEKAGLEGNWQADAWVLERKYPDKFGRRDRVQISGDPNAPVEVDLTWSDGSKLDRENEIVMQEEE